MGNLGRRTWLIPDMYWPAVTSPGTYVSHESICVLNMSDEEAAIGIDLYFEDAEPILGLGARCGARRTNHVRMDAMLDAAGKHIPRGVPYAAVVKSSAPVVVQYTRVDTTQCANALMTTMAYPVGERD